MALKFKATVIVPKSCIIAVAFLNTVHELNIEDDMLVTSGNDSTHMAGSKHYSDNALDFRTKQLTSGEKHELIAALTHRLGNDYDLILEDEGGPNEHLHVEYDPTVH